MSIKNYTLALFFFLSPILMFAQNTGVTLSGVVKDQTSGEILPYGNLVLKTEKDSVFVAGTVTNEQGAFVFPEVRPGQYVLEISFTGYKLKKKSLFVGTLSQFLYLGDLSLEQDTQTLSEVVVEGERATISGRLEKKTYNVDNNIAQSGGSVLDAMRAMPGVTVDQEGKVVLRGSDKVTVLIDGKQTALTGFGNQKGLDNIPSANIERIEIINNPSAKYNAAGMAGVINIIYKKEKEQGLHGDVGFTFGLGAITKRKADLPTRLGSYSANPKAIPSLNLNYHTPKFNFFLQPSVLFQEGLPNNEFTTRYYDDGRVIASQVPENRKQIHYILKGGAEWKLNENNAFTISGIYDYERHVDTSQVVFVNQHDENSRNRYYAWNEEEITGFTNVTVDYKHQFPQPGHVLTATTQFTKGWEDESYFLNDSSSVRQSVDTTMLLATEYTTNVAADYVKPLSSGRVELGTKLQWRRIPVEYTIGRGESSIIYPGLGDWSKWGENIYAAYLNYVMEKPDYDIEAGLRAEYTDVFYNLSPENIYYDQNDSYHYFELFPNIRFTYNFNENNRISAFYNRRVDRPGEPELRVFPKYDDPELLKVGNPYLRPQFTQAFELAYHHSWNKGSVYLAGYHRLIDNQFLRIYNTDTTSRANPIINKIYQNTGPATHTGLELIFDQKIQEFWNFSASINWFVNKIEAYEGFLRFPYERSYTLDASKDDTWDLKINNQFEFPNDFRLQLTGIYYAARNIPQGRQSARSSLDIGVGKKVMQGKGEITASFTDMLNRFGIQQELVGEGFTAVYENFYETQVFRVGFKYKF